MAGLDLDCESFCDFDDAQFGLVALERYDPGMVKHIRDAVAEERSFCREYLAPLVLEEDRKNAQDPNYISWELLRLAGRHGRLTGFIPTFLGGSSKGSLLGMGPVAEEQAAVDTGFSGMIGGHGLGLVALTMTFNFKAIQQVARKTVNRAHSEHPYVIDCAITEPTAGTDVEEEELYPKAKLVSRAQKVGGGAVLNGRKVFISTGHMASDHLILMPFDLEDPVGNYGAFLVPKDARGFSLGRKERKMGHRVSTVSELIFEDCFVPQKDIVMDTNQFAEPKYRSQMVNLLEMVLGITRTVVGAMSTGNARGSFERVLALAKTTKHKGRTLVNQQWAQTALTNMFMNVMMARAVYLEATFALMTNMDDSMSRTPPPFMNTGFAQKVFDNSTFQKLLHSSALRKRLLGRFIDTPPEKRARIQYMSSLAKVVGSDMAMENGHLAVEFLSRAGIRHDHGIEKGFRDAKLLQIFEGTNQLNRLNMFKHAVARRIPDVQVF